MLAMPHQRLLTSHCTKLITLTKDFLREIQSTLVAIYRVPATTSRAFWSCWHALVTAQAKAKHFFHASLPLKKELSTQLSIHKPSKKRLLSCWPYTTELDLKVATAWKVGSVVMLQKKTKKLLPNCYRSPERIRQTFFLLHKGSSNGQSTSLLTVQNTVFNFKQFSTTFFSLNSFLKTCCQLMLQSLLGQLLMRLHQKTGWKKTHTYTHIKCESWCLK
jgi:hypothetical protein